MILAPQTKTWHNASNQINSDARHVSEGVVLICRPLFFYKWRKKILQHAATEWIKYNPTSIFSPPAGEWCLWSMVIEGERNTFSGRLLESEGRLLLHWDGHRSFSLNDSLLYAHVIYPENHQTNAMVSQPPSVLQEE